jgi:hypothetical protein
MFHLKQHEQLKQLRVFLRSSRPARRFFSRPDVDDNRDDFVDTMNGVVDHHYSFSAEHFLLR